MVAGFVILSIIFFSGQELTDHINESDYPGLVTIIALNSVTTVSAVLNFIVAKTYEWLVDKMIPFENHA